MDDRASYILNEVLVRYERLYQRYNDVNQYYKNKMLELNNNEAIIKELMEINQKLDTKLFDAKEKTMNDLIFNIDLKGLQDFIMLNPDILKNVNASFLKINKQIEDHKWLINCMLVNIDTYMNIFFKLVFNVEKDNQLPQGFYDNPNQELYKRFSELSGELDKELMDFVRLHSLRNNIVHNDLIVDVKLKNKLKLTSDINCENIQMYLPNFECVPFYMVECLFIIYKCCECMNPSINIIEKLEDKDVAILLKGYCDAKKYQN